MTRILVVEDNPDLAYGLRNNLEIEGYRVEVADDGTAGLARARDASPDLMARAATEIASRLDPHKRFTVAPGTSTGIPARRSAMRATLRLSSPA